MILSIIIPVYNEQNTIEEIVRKVHNANLPNGIDKEVIIVDDGSTDRTKDEVKKLERMGLVIYSFHRKNYGKGAAIRTGISICSGDFVLIQDGDLEYDPRDYFNLLSPIINNQADVVFGSRFIGAGPHRVLYFWHYIGNKILTTFSNMFTNLNLTDMETCYKVFKRDVINNIKIKENRFGFEPEITIKIAQQKCRIYEVGISYYGRDYSEGKKIGWKDGFRAFYVIIKYGLLFREVK